MIYAVHVHDTASGLEKVVTVEARGPEDACDQIGRTGCRIVRVTPARPGVAAGVVMNPPAPARVAAVRRLTPAAMEQRRRLAARAEMIRWHNLITLWPFLAGGGSILWGLVQWYDGNDLWALVGAVMGVGLSVVGATRRWARDQGPWR